MQELSEHKTGHEKLDDSIRNTISSAFQQVGYSEKEKTLLRDIRFVREGGKSHNADMVAYSSSLRQDADTAVISVKGTENADKIQFDSEISPFRALATPVIVLAEYTKIRGMAEPRVRAVGLCKDAATFKREKTKSNIIPLSRFEEYLRDKQQFFTPRRLEKAKLVPEQLMLFDVAPDLIKQAIKIADKELVDRFEKGVREVIASITEKDKQRVINAAISVLGARILRDRLKENWPLSSGAITFLSFAKNSLPGYFDISSEIAGKLDPILKRLHSAFNFSQVSLDMVGKFYASAFVTKKLRDQWGIHYTPSILAKTLLRRMPIEELPPNNRIVADPTCGSGSLLTAGYERLANAAYLSIPQNERHQKLVGSIFGNDRDQFAAEITRMTLRLFHPPHKNNWKVTHLDAEKESFGRRWTKEIKVTPTIIVANPPFGGKSGGASNTDKPRTRNQLDRSALILNHCLDILPEGGLIGIILTETVLDQQLVKTTRHKILKKCQILEQWDIPVGWFDNVNRPAMAWVLRKTAPLSKMFYIRSLSDVPSVGREAKLHGTIHIDVTNPPEHLVPTVFDDILSKMEMSSNRINDYYSVMNGLQPLKGKVTQEKSEKAHPWSGNAEGTEPYSDLRKSNNGWLELVDANFGEKSQRLKLRKHLEQNEPMVMLRANRNAPWKYKWSSVALIDMPDNSRKVVVPSASYHTTFSKSADKVDKKNDIYALWSILNHPLASLWFHERQRVQTIPTKNYRKFALPANWNIENIQLLASIAKDLVTTKRNMSSKLHEPHDNLKIKTIVKKIDDIIYQMYEINEGERRCIEAWFGEEQRPLLEGICQRKTFAEPTNNLIRINYEVPEWETTCETLEPCFKNKLIRLVIDGLMDDSEDIESAEDGIWLKIIPAMPGWLLEKGAVGWVELTTDSAKRLKQSPEEYIVGFHLYKNAYKTQDEIDKGLFLISEMEMKKAVDE
ncbi:MAG: SAM-dependent DNA methyltransferase [Deltaproteobacteria bacterium]|nr:SAM-dependent DNA methyltransferase [Deltaproteobacteria bacterium]MBW1833628.1 SAM-dependent DNA methyltransferase [Deltaproteobacteria bacterium]MBW2165083.1 SAM-dependent DNA methyltransferase [Deltaproteobacteria bacterium]